MEYLKLNNLGNFLDLAALWKAYPRGGKEGDYCTAEGYTQFWDKFQNEWISSKDLASVPSESLPRETTDIYEDLNLHHDLNVAGTIRGKIEFAADSKGFASLAEYKAIIERLESLNLTAEESKTAIADLKKLAELLKEQSEKALTAAEEAEQYINGVLREELNGIFTQLDGTITSHFGLYTPTAENAPASEWTTLKEKEAHLNDTFTNKLDNRSYSWEIVDGEFCWVEIIDQTAAAALAAAAKAQDTADGKRKTFTRQPTDEDEYEVGDLWVNANYETLYTNEVLRAVEPKASGNPFDINHWILASKYTDDKMANEALGVANQAMRDAEALKEMLSKINDDTVLDVTEKTHLRTQWELINGTASLNLKGLTGSYYDTIELARKIGYLDASDNAVRVSYGGDIPVYDGEIVVYPSGSSSDIDLAYEALREFLVAVKLYSNDPTEEFDRIRMVQLFNSYYREETKLFDSAQRYYSMTQAENALENFINGEYLDDIQTLKRQIDQSAQTHVQPTDPSEEWTDEDTRHTHISDIWWNNSDSEINGVPAGATAIYQSKDGEYFWEVTPVPQSLFDQIDGKARVFVSKPSKYNVNDIWILEAEYKLGEHTYPMGTIVVATADSDEFNADHWEKKDSYTDSEDVDERIAATKEELNEAIEAAQTAADAAGDVAGKAQSAADEAKADAEQAKADAEQAAQKAESAQTAAEQAQSAADDAQTYAEQVSSVAEAANKLATELQSTKVGSEEYKAKLAEIDKLIQDVNQIAEDATSAAEEADRKAKGAQDTADNANSTLAKWALDNIISPVEKTELKNELAFIMADNEDVEYQRFRYELADENAIYVSYNEAYIAYKTKLEAIIDTEGEAAVDNLAQLQTDYYSARTAILDAIADAARAVADDAQTAANEAAELAVAAQNAADHAQQTAEQAIRDAQALKEMLDKINDDTMLDVVEKSHIRTQWELINGLASLSIHGEKGSYYDTLCVVKKLGYTTGDTVQVTYDGQIATYDGQAVLYQHTGEEDLIIAYEDLKNYLTKVKIYSDCITEGFVRTEMVELFNRYYQAEAFLLDRAQRYHSKTQAVGAIDEFVKGEYADDLAKIKESIDSKAETFVQSTDPAAAWNTDELKAEHEHDIWWNNGSEIVNGVPAGATAIYEYAGGTYKWNVTPIPQSLFDKIDGKATVFTSKPVEYHINDVWILESAYTINGVEYSAGTMVVAKQSSDKFNADHWEKKDSYTDDTAADAAKELADAAKELADAAQGTADGAKQDAENAQKAANDAQNAADTAQSTANNAQSAADTAQTTADNALSLANTLQKSAENLQSLYEELEETKVGSDEYNKKVAELVSESSRISGVAEAAKQAAATAQSEAEDAQSDAADAQQTANEAKSTLASWSADNVISPFEKQGVSDELAFINADKDEIDNRKGAYSISNEDALYATYSAAYTKYKGYLQDLIKNNDAIALQTDFDVVQTEFYDARTEILTAIAQAAKQIADLAKEAANAAETLAREAQEAAQAAMAATEQFKVILESINDDTILDVIEKRNIRTQWELINGAQSLNAPSAEGTYSKALALAESLGYMDATGSDVIVTYDGKRVNYGGEVAVYQHKGTDDLDLAYETLREYLRSIRLYSNESFAGFNRQDFALILTAYHVAETALINDAQAYYTEAQKQVALDEAGKALKAAGVSQEILGVTEELLESVDEADCILTVIEKSSLKQIYSVISNLTEVFVYGEDDDTVATDGTGTFHAIFNEALETCQTDKVSSIVSPLCTAFKNLQQYLINVGNIFGNGSTVVTNSFRATLYQKLGLYLSQEEKTRVEISKAYTGAAEQSLADNMAQKLGYSDYAALKALAESERIIIKGGRLNAALIEAKAITAAMIAVDELFAQSITASKMTLTEGCNIGGKVSIANEKILLNTDGSGHLASGAVSWDSDGDGEISGAWLNPIGNTTNALNRTVFISTNITSGTSISVGSYNSANVSSANPIKRLGSVTIISTNTTSPSYIYISGAKIAMPRIAESNKKVSSLMSLYSYLILAPGSSVTFDVYDEYSNSARVLRAKSPLGWFNFNGSIYPCTHEGAQYEDLASIKTYSNAIGTSLEYLSGVTVIDIPEGLVKYMKLKVGGTLSSSYDGSIYFVKTSGEQTNQTLYSSYPVSTLKTETEILYSSTNCKFRDGGSFGFGNHSTGNYTINYSPTLYVKLYDAGSMIAYFEITL